MRIVLEGTTIHCGRKCCCLHENIVVENNAGYMNTLW